MSQASTEFPVIATERALVRIRQILLKDGRPGAMLRIGLKGGGCSGLEYVMKVEEKAREGDLLGTWGDVAVLCDPKSASFLTGTTLDYTGNLIGGGFAFDNPNADRQCGCGTSFTPKAKG